MDEDSAQGYTTQELANYLGMSSQGLHWYEEKGLVNPLRRNGRRIYSVDDLCLLSRARFYRQAGFPLDEAKELLSLDVVEAGRQLDEKVDKMRQALEVERARVDIFASRAELARNFKSRVGKFERSTLDPFYYPWALSFDASRESPLKQYVARSWAQDIPFAQYLSVMIGSGEGGVDRSYAGFALPVRYTPFVSDEVRADIAQARMPVYSIGPAWYGLVEASSFDSEGLFFRLAAQLGLRGETIALLRRPVSCRLAKGRLSVFWEAWLAEGDIGL